MATDLTDPGDTGAGSNYVTNSPDKFVDVAVVKGYETPLSLVGDDDHIIKLTDKSDKPPAVEIPTYSPFTVEPSSIRGVESKIMTELETQVDSYSAFRNLIADTEGWIFLVFDPDQMTAVYNGEHFTDSAPDTTQKAVDGQNQLLKAVADCYTLVGEGVALLNNAAQAYVMADKGTFGGGGNVDEPVKTTPPGIIIT